MYFRPSTPKHHLALRNAAEKAWYEKPLWDSLSEWWNTPSGPPPAPGQAGGPPTPDGTAVAKGSTGYNAIVAEIEKKYGKMTGVGFRDVVGDGNYVYRQYSDGRIFIQVSGKGKTPVQPKVVDTKTTGGGLPPWVLPVGILGGSAVLGLGVFFAIRSRKAKGPR